MGFNVENPCWLMIFNREPLYNLLGLLLANLLWIMKWLEDWETWFSKGARNKIAWWIGHIGTYRLILAKLWLMISSFLFQFEPWTIKAVGMRWMDPVDKWFELWVWWVFGNFLGFWVKPSRWWSIIFQISWAMELSRVFRETLGSKRPTVWGLREDLVVSSKANPSCQWKILHLHVNFPRCS